MTLAQLARSLGHPTRLAMLRHLAQAHEASVGELARAAGGRAACARHSKGVTMDPACRDMVARAAQAWLLDQPYIPGDVDEAEGAFDMLMEHLLGEPRGRFMDAIITEMVEIDAWNK